MRTALGGILIAALLATGPAWAETTEATETYDLLFKTGTLDALPRDESLIYTREVTNALNPDAEDRDSGKIELQFHGGEPEQAQLTFRQNEKHRSLGAFPASVGNPIIMYFVETVVRDMAESAGGSPFYIRNRVKDALVAPAEVTGDPVSFDGEAVSARAVTLRPFAEDPNADRMKGFGALEITVTMSDKVPGWYHTLAARVPGPGDAPIYSSTLTLSEVGEIH